jgi:hypothetical protein
MGLLILLICAIWLFYTGYAKTKEYISRKKRANQINNQRFHSTQVSPKKQQTSHSNIYRPSTSRKSGSSITFTEINTFNNIPNKSDLTGLNDAFTGEPLRVELGLHQCQKCKVYYHSSSLEVINSENSGRCVACLNTNIIAITPSKTYAGGRNYQTEVVTLDNYKRHIGHAITFEGYVPRINISRDGCSYAVMFENKSWKYGLKMVVFKGNVSKVGGSSFINSLKGKTIRIRGLLTYHETFGYQIIVSERSMIMSVK